MVAPQSKSPIRPRDAIAHGIRFVAVLGFAGLALLGTDRLARRLEATCTWEARQGAYDVPKCVVRTTGILSSEHAVVYPRPAMWPGGYGAMTASETSHGGWRALVRRDRVELAKFCTELEPLSVNAGGPPRDVVPAARALNRFFEEKLPEVRVAYGP